jgi:hypothetical protein
MKTTEELIQEFLDNGGEIEKLPTIEPDNKQTIGSTTKKTPQIMTLPEGADMFGEKQKRRKKVKKQDFSDIDLDLIPEHLHNIIKKNSASDEQSGDHKGGNESETN